VILENGVVRTMDPQLPTARALAIAGHLVAGGIGVHETALASPEVVDLRGRSVLPGFTDSHTHFPTWSMAQREVRLEGCGTKEEAVARVHEAVERARPGEWVRGTGWRSGEWHPHVEPARGDLDPFSGDTPIALMARDYHSLWLNSAALSRANGDLLVPGGVVETDERGEPTGLLRESSAWHFRDTVSLPSPDEFVDAMRVGQKLASSRGVTAIHDKDGWLGALGLFQRLRASGSPQLRVWQSQPHERIDALRELGIRSGFGDPFLRVGYIKAFMDGTLGSQTARMLVGSGVVITSGEDLREIIVRAAEAGFPVGVHAIGDLANRQALDAFEATREVWEPLGLRQRIEHCQCLAPEELPRFAELGITCSVQFSHAVSDRDLAEEFWPDKLAGTYAFRSLFESGAVVCNGSDAPIEELDPLLGIRSGVTRTWDERGPWRPQQAVTVQQALEATTINPSWLAGDERRRGRLLPGYFADLVILNRDPLDCPVDELESIEVVATMLGGSWTHNPPPWD
jgi:predicted amidohydrolase YtcJ